MNRSHMELIEELKEKKKIDEELNRRLLEAVNAFTDRFKTTQH